MYREQLVPRIVRDASEKKASWILVFAIMLIVRLDKFILWFSFARP